jgi:hypothetical protein
MILAVFTAIKNNIVVLWIITLFQDHFRTKLEVTLSFHAIEKD